MSLRVALGLTMALIGLAACSGQPVSAPAPGVSSLSASAASAEPSSPDLGVPRAVHSATTLADGRVLIAGGCTTPGCDGFDAARTIEIYDPRSRTLSEGPRLAAPRANHTATLLAGGRVLFTGGYPRASTSSMVRWRPCQMAASSSRAATGSTSTTPRTGR
jgi:hypothetical protein